MSITKNNTKVIDVPATPGECVDHTIVRLHDTDIVTFSSTGIVLNTGGWRTPTTKSRMNEVSREYDLGYHVFQKNHEWFVQMPNGKVEEFTEQTFRMERRDQ